MHNVECMMHDTGLRLFFSDEKDYTPFFFDDWVVAAVGGAY